MWVSTCSPFLSALLRRTVAARVYRKVRRGFALHVAAEDPPASDEYSIIPRDQFDLSAPQAWDNWSVALRQHSAYQAIVKQMGAGQPRQDLLTAAEAVRFTGIEEPCLLEVGCGSGYYSEILPYLLGYKVHYVGLDSSWAMARLAAASYPAVPFLVADGAALPFRSSVFPIVLNGVALMHMPRYAAAIAEARRVASRWCIFHTVPVLQKRPTTFLCKRAYGKPTIEVVFNEQELRTLLETSGLAIESVVTSIPYNLEAVLGEPTETKTFVCQVAS